MFSKNYGYPNRDVDALLNRYNRRLNHSDFGLDTNFDKVQRTFGCFFATMAIITVVALIALGTGVVFLVAEVKDHGVKGVIEKVWNGPTNVTKTVNNP